MAAAPFSIWTNQLVLASNFTIQPNQQIDILTSPLISNDSGTIYNSLRINIDYNNLVPDIGNFAIGAIVEQEVSAEVWNPIAYQFSAHRTVYQGSSRIIVLQPNIDSFNQGIEDVVYPVDKEVARISRQQGKLPEAKFRLRIMLSDADPQGPYKFEQVKITANGEKYNV